MWNRLTSGAKFFIILLLVGGLGAGLYFGGVINPTEKTDKKSGKTETAPKKSKSLLGLSRNDELTIVVNTWGGYTPLAYLNGGSLDPNPNSIITKEYGIDLSIKVIDFFDDSRNTFKSGNADIVYCTVDAMPVEMGSGGTMALSNAQVWLQVDWSRGGDLIVVRKGITTVGQLKGKSIAVAEGTASHTFLIKVLESNGLTVDDVKIVKVSDGIEAARLFKAGQVDAAAVWTPDDLDCMDAQEGSKVLISTNTAKYVIADGLISTKEFIEENQDLLVRFATAWLTVNAEMAQSTTLQKEAAAAFAEVFGMDEFFSENGVEKVRFTTVGDNKNFFGLNSQYNGVDGEELYSKMSIKYQSLNLTTNPLPWRKVSNTTIVEQLNFGGSEQLAEATTSFAPATAAVKTKEAVSSKKVSINFETNSYFLSDDAKYIIDKEFAGLAKDFAGLRIRVEGNTDATGNDAANSTLSFKRAQSVVDYLVKEYGFDPDRFIVQGNGSRQAKAAGVLTSNENYRRTDFQFVEE
ncbi:MAG TPA: phosphate ABC transporter substrate-binding/OmpA family protein [Candidatus Glassbacteria bacterium]|nr:phosphate ABC transporter substrate-binding/OmpA family protein [Candidatus Glassbacteria bacterium]